MGGMVDSAEKPKKDRENLVFVLLMAWHHMDFNGVKNGYISRQKNAAQCK
jgi:hypothetical protein